MLRFELAGGAFVIWVLAFVGPIQAQTWDGGGANQNWSTAQNWSSDLAPLNNGTASLIFAGSVFLSPNVDTAWSINSLGFSSGASSFTIGGNPLSIGNGGLVNFSTAAQTINISTA